MPLHVPNPHSAHELITVLALCVCLIADLGFLRHLPEKYLSVWKPENSSVIVCYKYVYMGGIWGYFERHFKLVFGVYVYISACFSVCVCAHVCVSTRVEDCFWGFCSFISFMCLISSFFPLSRHTMAQHKKDLGCRQLYLCQSLNVCTGCLELHLSVLLHHWTPTSNSTALHFLTQTAILDQEGMSG